MKRIACTTELIVDERVEVMLVSTMVYGHFIALEAIKIVAMD